MKDDQQKSARFATLATGVTHWVVAAIAAGIIATGIVSVLAKRQAVSDDCYADLQTRMDRVEEELAKHRNEFKENVIDGNDGN